MDDLIPIMRAILLHETEKIREEAVEDAVRQFRSRLMEQLATNAIHVMTSYDVTRSRNELIIKVQLEKRPHEIQQKPIP